MNERVHPNPCPWWKNEGLDCLYPHCECGMSADERAASTTTAEPSPSPESPRPVSTDREEGEQVSGGKQSLPCGGNSTEGDEDNAELHALGNTAAQEPLDVVRGEVRRGEASPSTTPGQAASADGQPENAHPQALTSTSSADALPQTPPPDSSCIEAEREVMRLSISRAEMASDWMDERDRAVAAERRAVVAEERLDKAVELLMDAVDDPHSNLTLGWIAVTNEFLELVGAEALPPEHEQVEAERERDKLAAALRAATDALGSEEFVSAHTHEVWLECENLLAGLEDGGLQSRPSGGASE